MRLVQFLRMPCGTLARVTALAALLATSLLAPSLHNPQLLLADGEAPPVFLYFSGEAGSDPGQFADPRGIAVGTDGKIYVADTDNDRVQVLDSDGTSLLQWTGFNRPRGIAVDSSGNVYVADTNNNRVVVLDDEGTVTHTLTGSGGGPGLFSSPSGVALTPDGGTLYVADTYNDCVQVFTLNGGVYVHDHTLGEYGAWGDVVGTFSNPEGVALGPDGSVYVLDTSNCRVQKFDGDGWTVIAGSGVTGSAPGVFFLPAGIAVDTNGNVYIADTLNSRIQKFTSDGDFLMTFGQQGSGNYSFKFPDGVAVTAEGIILIADTSNDCIKAYRPASYYEAAPAFLAKWGSSGSCSDGDLCGPISIAIDEDGYVYVGNNQNSRVQKFTASGDFIATWGTPGTGENQVQYPNGIAVDAAGNIYVVDGGDMFTPVHHVHEVTWNVSHYESITTYEPTGDPLSYPFGAALNTDDSVLYVADSGNSRILKLDLDTETWGTFADTWDSGSGEDQLNQPHGVAVDHQTGWVYVVDTYNDRIVKFDSDGEYVTHWGEFTDFSGPYAGQFDKPFGIAIDADGNVYVTGIHDNRIQKFNSDGGYLTGWGSEGSGDGQFNGPHGVAVHPNGSIYVCDSGNNRIQVFGEAPPTVDLILDLKAGWNMVSVPVVPADASRAAVFPPADVVAVYTWNPSQKSYEVPTNIAPEVGYWIAVTEPKTITVTGTPKTTWTYPLTTGWNMIGSVYGDSVPVANLATDEDPDPLLRNAIYWWNPGSKSYVAETSIVQGCGYWAATTVDCVLTMCAPAPI